MSDLLCTIKFVMIHGISNIIVQRLNVSLVHIHGSIRNLVQKQGQCSCKHEGNGCSFQRVAPNAQGGNDDIAHNRENASK